MPDADDLVLAAQDGKLAKVRKLLAAGVAPADQALFLAAQNGHVEVVAALAEAGARADARSKLSGYTPLVAAAVHDHAEVVAALAARAKVDGRDASGFTPLMHAALNGSPAAARALLAAGADPKLASRRKETALDIAERAAAGDADADRRKRAKAVAALLRKAMKR